MSEETQRCVVVVHQVLQMAKTEERSETDYLNL